MQAVRTGFSNARAVVTKCELRSLTIFGVCVSIHVCVGGIFRLPPAVVVSEDTLHVVCLVDLNICYIVSMCLCTLEGFLKLQVFLQSPTTTTSS